MTTPTTGPTSGWGSYVPLRSPDDVAHLAPNIALSPYLIGGDERVHCLQVAASELLIFLQNDDTQQELTDKRVYALNPYGVGCDYGSSPDPTAIQEIPFKKAAAHILDGLCLAIEEGEHVAVAVPHGKPAYRTGGKFSGLQLKAVKGAILMLAARDWIEYWTAAANTAPTIRAKPQMIEWLARQGLLDTVFFGTGDIPPRLH